MPFFLIPAIIVGASAMAGGKGLFDLNSANNLRTDAASRKEQAQKRLDGSAVETDAAVEQTKEQLGRLLVVRFSALAQLDDVVRWLQAGEVGHDLETEGVSYAPAELAEWNRAGVDAGVAMRDLLTSVGVGAGARALAMGAAAMLGQASTGIAIGALSGAAARSASLAWIGGGALAAGGGGMALGTTVLSGLNVGLAVLGVGLTARKLAAAYDVASKDFDAKVDTECANQEVVRRSLGAIRQRCDQLRRAINAVAHLTQTTISTCSPTDPGSRTLVIKLAQALSKLARYRVIDEVGALAANWSNPYDELRPTGLQGRDDDFVSKEQ